MSPRVQKFGLVAGRWLGAILLAGGLAGLLGLAGCGSGPLVDSQRPMPPGPLAWAQVSAGFNHTLAVKNDGTLWGWGGDGLFQLADSGNTLPRFRPIQISPVANWKQAAAGSQSSMALKTDGTLWAWGDNPSGEFGFGASPSSTAVMTQVLPVPPPAPPFRAIAKGSGFTVILMPNGTVWATGSNGNGQLGNGTVVSSDFPVQVCAPGQIAPCGLFLTGISAIAAGETHVLALRSDGSLWAWGGNTSGQLGYGNTIASSVPIQVCADPICTGFLTSVVAMSAGGLHSLAVRTDGTLWTWGDNTSGQLGDGTTTLRTTPVQVCAGGQVVPPACTVFLTGVVAVAAGNDYSLALRQDGAVMGFGNDLNSVLGDDVVPVEPIRPIAQPLHARPAGWTAISTSTAPGGYSVMGIQADRSLWAWGNGASGKLGDGSAANLLHPMQLP